MSDCTGTGITPNHSASGAGFRGFFQGFSGLLGIGGFWKAADNSQFTELSKQFTQQRTELDTALANHKNVLTTDQQKFATEQSQNMQDNIDFHDSVLQDEITQNTLLIQITMVIVIIIIIYLIIL
jgi:hypothetical protein